MSNWCSNGYNPAMGSPEFAELMGYVFTNVEDRDNFTIDTTELLERYVPVDTMCKRCCQVIGVPYPVEYEGVNGMILRKYFPGTAPLSTDVPLSGGLPRHIFYRGKLICVKLHPEGGRWVHIYDDESYGVPDGLDLGPPMASPDFPRECSQFISPVLDSLLTDVKVSEVVLVGLGKRLMVPESAVIVSEPVNVVQNDDSTFVSTDRQVFVESDEVSELLASAVVEGDIVHAEGLRVTEVRKDEKLHPIVCLADVSEYEVISTVVTCSVDDDTVVTVNNNVGYIGGRDTVVKDMETTSAVCAGRVWICTKEGHVSFPTFPMKMEVRSLSFGGIFDGKSTYTAWRGTPFVYGKIDFRELMSRVAPDKRGKVLRSSVNSIQLLGKYALDFFRAVSCLRGGMTVEQMQSAVCCDNEEQGKAFEVYAKHAKIYYGIHDYAMYKYYIGVLLLTNPDTTSLIANCIYPFGVQPKPFMLGPDDRHLLSLSDGSCGEAVVKEFSFVSTKFLRMCVAYRFCYISNGLALAGDIDNYIKLNLCNEKLGLPVTRGVGLTKMIAERKRARFMVEVFRNRMSLRDIANTFQILDTQFWADICLNV